MVVAFYIPLSFPPSGRETRSLDLGVCGVIFKCCKRREFDSKGKGGIFFFFLCGTSVFEYSIC